MKTLYCFSIFLLFFLFPKEVLAQVKINEILPNPVAGENEWVELYNPGSEVVNLSGWKLNDEANHLKDVSFLGIIGGGQFAVYEYSGDGWLNNSTGDTVYLIDATNVAVDSYYYGSDPGEGKSFGRYPDGGENWFVYDSPSRASSNPDPAPPELSPTPTSSPTPTPSATPTPIPTPTPTPTATPNDYDNLYISEYLPNPESGNEWVELYNANDFEVNLNGWFIDDLAAGGSPPLALSGTIPAGGYKQFYLTSAFLNNGGDEVRLLDGSQNEKDATSFANSTKGKSWSNDDQGNWCQTDPTPNSPNPSCPTASVSLTPTATPRPTPTPAKKLTPTPTPTEKEATESGEVLGEEESSPSAFYGLESPSPSPGQMPAWRSQGKKLVSFLLLGGGLGLLFAGAFWGWYTRIR